MSMAYFDSVIFRCSSLVLSRHSFIIEIIILKEILKVLVPPNVHALELFLIPSVH